MDFGALPESAAWRHRNARDGFEVVFSASEDEGFRCEGHTSAVESDRVWAVRYRIKVDVSWVTRSATLNGQAAPASARKCQLEGDGAGRWQVNGASMPNLDGCLDVDVESSVFTNTVPVHRLGLAVGEEADAPAVYVRALDLSIERLEQSYARLDDQGSRQRYRYTAPALDFEAELVYDGAGLVLEYPGLATRVA
jgi:uncharacterized protein